MGDRGVRFWPDRMHAAFNGDAPLGAEEGADDLGRLEALLYVQVAGGLVEPDLTTPY